MFFVQLLLGIVRFQTPQQQQQQHKTNRLSISPDPTAAVRHWSQRAFSDVPNTSHTNEASKHKTNISKDPRGKYQHKLSG